MDKYDERFQQIAERTLAAKFSLWSGLLTAHTVLLSVAAAILVAVKPSAGWSFKLAGLIAIFCVVVLLLNFALTKAQYEAIGQRLANPNAGLSESARERDIAQAVFRWRVSAVCEFVATLGLFVEVVIFGWILGTI